MALPPGSRLGAYEIIDSLGAGGMGEVYRARDARLGRDVALKILPPEVVAEAGRLERFDREARAIAALNHPHIVTIHSTEEAEGVRFLTMELVEGQTLAESIVEGGVSLPKFLAIAVPLADALTAAHQKEITHRDLKPANVMLTHDGRVKVLDFGLARVGATDNREHSLAATLAPVTQHGTIVGTMPYMSPEQIEGAKLDPRSDLFSLGVIFYELLTGERPFQGGSSPALMSAILRDAPADITTIRADVPAALARLITRCLEKRPENRVQTARDVYNELRHLQKLSESSAARPASGSASSVGLRVAVLPFSARAGDEEAAAIAEALTEDITTGLSRFANLRVLSRASADRLATARPSSDASSARYLIDGSVRRSGTSIRISVRLADADTGANLWAEHFTRDVGQGTFAVQDEVANRIVATIGDQTGVLAAAMASAIADVPLDQLGVPELVVRYYVFSMHLREEEHARLRDAFERAVEREPRAANAWACLAMLYEMEHSHLFNSRPDPLVRQRHAAQRAVEADPQSQQAWTALASGHVFARDLPALRGAVERAVLLNPLNADLVTLCALFLSVAGDGDRAMELARGAAQVKPHHPGWYHFPAFNAYYLRGEYDEALREAKLINMPHLVLAQTSAVAAAGQLGRAAEAQTALDTLRSTNSALIDVQQARHLWSIWIWDEEFLDRLTEGFAKGLDLVKKPAVHARPASSASRAPASDAAGYSAFTVNVLPFQAPAAGDAAALADGLAQGVVVGLSRFQYLRVIARAFAADAIATGYTLQGSVREAGGVVRVVMQLANAQTNANVWAETYDRSLHNASLFDLQDELTATIVATIADANGALVRSMSAVVRAKPIEALTPYEAVLRRFAYISVMSPSEHALVREALELALERAPGYAAAWAVLAQIYVDEFAQGYNPRPNPLERARAAADKALDIDPSTQHAYLALALIGFFSKDHGAFRAAADRALALNPLDSATMSLLGTLTAYSGDWETGLALAERARTLNPHHPGIYWLVLIVDRYRHGDYTGALELLNRVNMPSYPNSLLVRAAIYAQLGRIDEGRVLLREAEARAPGITGTDGGTRLRWFTPELVAKIDEALNKLRVN